MKEFDKGTAVLQASELNGQHSKKTSYSTQPSVEAFARPINLKNQIDVLWHHRKLAISVALVISLCSSLYAVFVFTPKYTSNSQVLIKDSVIKARYVTSDINQSTTSQSANPVLNTMELLKSDEISQALWDTFLLRHPKEIQKLKIKTYSEWNRLYQDGKGLLKYKNVPGTDAIMLSFTWSADPVLAKEGMESVVNGYKKASLNINKLEHHQRHEHLLRQIAMVRQDLNLVRADISAYKAKHKVYDVTKEIENYTKDRITLELAMKSAQAEANDYSNRTKEYEKAMGMPVGKAISAASIGRNLTLAKMYDEYYILSQSHASLKSRYTDEHVKVREVSSQLKQKEADINREIQRSQAGNTSRVSASHAITDDTRALAVGNMLAVEAQSQGLQSRATALKNYYGELQGKLISLPEIEKNLAELHERETSLSESMKTLEGLAVDARIREAQTLSNVFVIKAPSIPNNPDAPGRSQVILFGLVAGIMGGLSTAVLAHKAFGSPSRQSVDKNSY